MGKYLHLLIMLFSLYLMASCSGEETGTGFDDNTIYIGAVSKINNNIIDVNGIPIDTNGATIKIDDNPSNSDLQEGMVVVVSGSTDDNGNFTASSIVAKYIIEGKIETNPVNGSFELMGFTVNTTELTRIENGVVLQVDNYVKISGFLSAAQTISATRIEESQNNAGVKITGAIVDLNSTAFFIGPQEVDYSNISVDEIAQHFGATGLQENLLVEVRGLLNNNIVVANKIEPHGVELNDALKAHIDGYIQSVQTNGFTLTNGLVVATDGNTEYQGGVEADLAAGMEIEVEGPVNNGVLNAIKVKFKDNIKLQSVVISNSNNIVQLEYLDLIINIENVPQDKLETVVAGDLAEIRAYRGSNGQLNAVEVRLRDNNPKVDYRVILEGPVTNINQPELDILGITVSGVSQFRNLNGATITENQFFELIDLGSLVKAQGDVSGNSVIWNSFEAE